MIGGIDAKFIGHGGVLLAGNVERAMSAAGWGNEFDVIVSLGGNCSVAHNLRVRNLRPFSLPFDWLLMDDARPIEYLPTGFTDGFKDFCLQEILVELKGAERGEEHPGRLQYLDAVSGWKFIHHFNESDDFNREYKRVYDVLSRRIRRLDALFLEGGRYLLILAPTFKVSKTCLDRLMGVLRDKYGNTSFYYIIMSFDEMSADVEVDRNLIYAKVKRPQNVYDFSKTNVEWSFLDRIKLSGKTDRPGPSKHKLQLFNYKGFKYILRWHIDKKPRKGFVE